MRESIALMIQQFAAEKPEAAAVIVNDETCTYAQLASANRKAARWLQEKGIRPGDRIIVEADHILDYVYFWYGLQLLGVLPQDEGVYRCDCDGEPSAKLPDSNPVKQALKGILQSIGL